MKDPKFLRLVYTKNVVQKLSDHQEVTGSSPPEIFVGEYGYPKVSIGPVISVEYRNAAELNSPSRWVSLSVEDLIRIRSYMVRGKYTLKANDISNPVIQRLQELAISERDAQTFADVYKVDSRIRADEGTIVSGPSFVYTKLSFNNLHSNYLLEKVYYDTDFRATDAIIYLYRMGYSVYDIQRLLSVGGIGVKERRKIVPTRWSITAIDDALSKENLKEVKQFEPIDKIIAFKLVGFNNRWLIGLFPGQWEYESMEAWYPGTTWNSNTNYIYIYSSHEGFKGRTTYAEIGGCYYAARLEVSEYLRRIKRQAKVVILREAHPGYSIPLGVWNVREHVRAALETQPIQLNSIDDFLSLVNSFMDIKANHWIKNGVLLKSLLFSTKLVGE
jgi:hypothetical protein